MNNTDIKNTIKDLMGDDLRVKKPCIWINSTLIIVSVLVYVGLCLFLYGTLRYCCCCGGNWIRFVIAALLIVAFSVLEYQLVKALFDSRKETLSAYRKEEMKLACVYDKFMDMYVEGKKKENEPKNENPTKQDVKDKAYQQILDAYVEALRKGEKDKFATNEEVKGMVEGLIGK